MRKGLATVKLSQVLGNFISVYENQEKFGDGGHPSLENTGSNPADLI